MAAHVQSRRIAHRGCFQGRHRLGRLEEIVLPDTHEPQWQTSLAHYQRTCIAMHARPDKPQNAAAVFAFFKWAYANGDTSAASLDYVPIPADVKATILQSWLRIQDASGKPVIR